MKSPIPILDCHGHIGVHPDFPHYKTAPAEMVRVMDHLNIEKLAVTSTLACYNDCPRGNEEVAEVLREFPDRFLGYITVNPNPPGEAIAELLKHKDFHHPPLIKFHPELHQYPVNGPHYMPVYEYANQTGAIILVHTWDSDANCGPLMFASLGKQFPRMRVILGHSGVTWRGYTQAIETVKQTENTFMDISGSQSHRTVMEHSVEQVGHERILFGSDMPFLEASMLLGRVMTARISDAAKEAILRKNFERLLNEK